MQRLVARKIIHILMGVNCIHILEAVGPYDCTQSLPSHIDIMGSQNATRNTTTKILYLTEPCRADLKMFLGSCF